MTQKSPPQDPAELTRHIETRFHAQHRERIPVPAQTAERVETVHFGDLALPEGACGTWTALYTGLSEFLGDLEGHVRLENDVLFPQFEPA